MRLTHPQLLKVFHEIVFGIEDSLVSTVGLLSGVAASGASTHTIILTGVVLVFVEAFSMGMGSILADNSTREIASHKELPLSGSFLAGSAMFLSYIFAGFIPWIPYTLSFLSRDQAFAYSIGASIATLFILGLVQGKLAHIHLFRQGAQMALVGGLAILLGIMVGRLVG